MSIELVFDKMNGLGNDFVVVTDMADEIKLSDAEVVRLCDRHVGIGGDGVILVKPSPRDECAAYMHYINSDGTLAQMCGNGVRCFAKHLVDHGIIDASAGRFVADTLAGPRPIDFELDESGRMSVATVDMGRPVLDPSAVPIDACATMESAEGEAFVGNRLIPSPWGDFAFTAVSMGNPHAICFLDDLSALPDELFVEGAEKSLPALRIDGIGAFYEANPIFPEKANIEFAVVDEGGIHMRVYERGCGETLACGTGACATNVAAALTGRAPRQNVLHLLGGDLQIDWKPDGRVFMTGPAETAFTGRIEI